ncbi:hypothetical protein LTR94_026495, partial [Friedmanniomyces endolithicus]
MKPVKREKLAEVLKGLEAALERRLRRVLVVEDDPVQRDAVSALLSSSHVEITGVGTAADCLEALGSETFDCMVLDLALPDASGFSLLETLSRDDARSFPPVIVYTGKDLTEDQEQQLRRHSSSIIIKGAKSPERLLDEVSLFLHQVVSDLPAEKQKLIRKARNRDAALEGKRILIVEDDVRNVYSLTHVLEPRGALVEIARNGQEALEALSASASDPAKSIDLVLMDVMMPVMDGLTAVRKIRQEDRWSGLPIVMLTAKAMPDDQERCLQAGANDYMAKPIDVDKLLSLVRLLLEAIFQRYHYDFRHYARASIKRRLLQAREQLGYSTLSDIQTDVLHDASVLPRLLGYLTVQVSEMFRDPTYFRTLRETVLPHLQTWPSLKVWIAGCSHGEEVYSMAILFKEEGLYERTLFYATDINPEALRAAEAGVYSLDRIRKFTENHQRA